jgi:hypothetical protein
MVHVDPPALWIGIDRRHSRRKRVNGKSGSYSYRSRLLKDCSAGKIARGRPGTRPGHNWGSSSVFTRIDRQNVLSFHSWAKGDAQQDAPTCVSIFSLDAVWPRLSVHGITAARSAGTAGARSTSANSPTNSFSRLRSNGRWFAIAMRCPSGIRKHPDARGF